MQEFNDKLEIKQGSIHCLSIIGHIEGHHNMPEDVKTTKYEHIMPLIAAIEESPEIKALLILLNTVGGDVEAGLAMAELIAGMTKPTASLVLGGGHSIGVPLAVAAKKSFIAPSASMTIHPVRINGMIIASPQSFDYLASMQERVCRFIVGHSGISRQALDGLMEETGKLSTDMGTILNGSEAVACGLIDSLGSLSDALEYLRE